MGRICLKRRDGSVMRASVYGGIDVVLVEVLVGRLRCPHGIEKGPKGYKRRILP
jgi:hypothetical protein